MHTAKACMTGSMETPLVITGMLYWLLLDRINPIVHDHRNDLHYSQTF